MSMTGRDTGTSEACAFKIRDRVRLKETREVGRVVEPGDKLIKVMLDEGQFPADEGAMGFRECTPDELEPE